MQLGGVLATELLCSLKVCEKAAVLLESLMVNVRGAYKEVKYQLFAVYLGC
jgi:hypothetical protein